MSGRPPPPLPPTAAAAARTSFTALNRPVQLRRNPDNDAGLAFVGGYQRHHTVADLLADRIRQALQIARRHLAQVARGEASRRSPPRPRPHRRRWPACFCNSATCRSSRRLSSSSAATRSGASSGLRPQCARDLVQPTLCLIHHRLGERAGHRLDATHPGGNRALRQDLEIADIAGAPHMRAAAQLDRLRRLVAFRPRPIATTRTSSPYFSPNSAIAPVSTAASGVISRVVTSVFSRMRAFTSAFHPGEVIAGRSDAAGRRRSAAGRARSGCPSA